MVAGVEYWRAVAPPFTVKTCPAVPSVVSPVPPFVVAKVPLRTTAPVVAVDGENPVVPALNEVTPPDVACHDAVEPLDVNT